MQVSPLSAKPTQLQAGIGLRGMHHNEVLNRHSAVGWFEVHTENYLGGGSPAKVLNAVRRDYPVSLHGVGLSLGSAEGLDKKHLERIANLVDQVDPFLVSEHLSWSVISQTYLNDLLPLPYTEEALAVVERNIGHMQDRLKRRVLIENPSTYLTFTTSEMGEAEFLSELSKRTGCGLLCDVNNIYVTCSNHGGDAVAYLRRLPTDAVGEIHLAGHAVNDADGTTILIDDHGSAVKVDVWELYKQAVRLFPQAPALIEWDSEIPAFDVLLEEATKADKIRAEALKISASTEVAA